MIVYNITVSFEEPIENEFLQWQTDEQIPSIMATELFDSWKRYRLLGTNEGERTYIIQFSTDSAERFETYLEQFDQPLREKAYARWGNTFIAFHTAMQAVQ